MSAKRSRKISKLIIALLPVAFLSIIGIVVLAIVSVVSIAQSELPAEQNGIPSSWRNYEEAPNVESKVTARILNDKYIQYVASLKNNSDSEELAISHLASYINGNENSGFVSLSSDSLEYTYEPDRANSWTPVSISGPGIASGDFKFDYDLYAGHSGTKTDTIYFRFNVNTAKDGVIDNIISYVAKDSAGADRLITSSVSIDTDTEAASEPSSQVASWATISTVKFNEASKSSLSSNVIIVISAIGVFALGIAIYLVCRM